MMSAANKPSLSSARVQRAMRLNLIEDGRLQHRMTLMNKESMHHSRLINQNIRVINLTLDYIQTTSGISPEGLGKDSGFLPGPGGRSVGPCFLYGDRIGSRRFGKFRRTDSAASFGSSATAGQEVYSGGSSAMSSFSHASSDELLPSLVGRTVRGGTPGRGAASPGVTSSKMRRYSSTSLNSLNSGIRSASPKRAKSRTKSRHPPETYSGPPRLGTVQISTNGFSRPGSRHSRPQSEGDELGERIRSAIAKVLREAEINEDVDRELEKIHNRKRQETTGCTEDDIANARRSRMLRSAGSVHPLRTASPAKQREILDLKRRAHSARQRQVDDKIQGFLRKFALSKSTTV